ncbi:MAG TPA: TrmJ/YjtD family RNA methyltransferase [Verrucomicrobiae bacterium]|nr:TrmJ/YjtD family RNA methyltransferase [Verrucomicrobiae bacterium]
MRKPAEKHPEPVLTFGAPRNLANVSVILVEPAVPGNIGSAARAMKTMGITDLVVLSGPKNFTDHQQAIMLGHGAGDVLKKSLAVTTWEEATEGLHWLVGTTHRKRRAQFPQVIEARQAAMKIAELSRRNRVGIVFGREEAGLTDIELRRCHDIASVPQAADHPSLNLAQAVMLFAYEIYLASLGEVPKPRYNLATVHEVEFVLKHLSESLAKVGFRPHQGDPDSFIRSLRRVIARAPLEKRDCNVLHRICQQIDYFAKEREKVH